MLYGFMLCGSRTPHADLLASPLPVYPACVCHSSGQYQVTFDAYVVFLSMGTGCPMVLLCLSRSCVLNEASCCRLMFGK